MKQSQLVDAYQTLLNSQSDGMLATLSLKHPGFPFASVTPFAVDKDGRPLFLMSSMATHSKNLKADSKATLLVTGSPSQLSEARASIVGTVVPVPAEDIEAAATAYLERHPEAKQWISFGDFGLFRLEVIDIYFIGGFGAMGWIQPEG